jgi:hypothetical protein
MTLCPVALVIHCVGCPIVKVCPAKTSIGDYGRYPPPAAGGKRPNVPK